MDDLACEHCGHPPRYKARERLQEPYRGMWQAIVAHIRDLSPDIAIYQRDLDRRVAEIADAQPQARAAFALATTRYGREEIEGA